MRTQASGIVVHMKIGVRQLRDQLAEVLDRASRGETIEVTERGHPKALIVPIPGEDRIARGLREGWLRGPQPGAVRPGAVSPVKARATVQEMADEDRGE